MGALDLKDRKMVDQFEGLQNARPNFTHLRIFYPFDLVRHFAWCCIFSRPYNTDRLVG